MQQMQQQLRTATEGLEGLLTPAALEALPAGHPFTVPENLFAKITDEMREAMEARFAGK